MSNAMTKGVLTCTIIVATAIATWGAEAPAPNKGSDNDAIHFNSRLELRVFDATGKWLGNTPAPTPEGVRIPTGTVWYVESPSVELDDSEFNELCDEIERNHIPGLSLEGHSSVAVTAAGWSRLDTLTDLKWLRLQCGQAATVRALRHIESLKQLESLDVSRQDLYDWDLDEVLRLTNLKELHLSATRITDATVAALAKLPNLRILGLAKTGISDDAVSDVAKLASLTNLDVSSTKLSANAIADLRRCHQLVELNLNETAVDDVTLASLRTLTQLKIVSLERGQDEDESNGRPDSVAATGRNPKQTASSSDSNAAPQSTVSDAGLAILASLPKLEELSLSGQPITDQGLHALESMGHLRSLDLAGCRQLSDRGTQIIRTLKKLEHLDLSETKLTDAGLERLKTLVSLKELSLGKTRVSDKGVSHLSALTNLEILDLSSTAITDRALRTVGLLKNIRNLSLDGTVTTDAGARHLNQLSQIESLHLSQTVVTDTTLKMLSKLSRLGVLDLSECQHISDDGLNSLLKMTSLYAICVSGGAKVSKAGLDPLAIKCGKTAYVADVDASAKWFLTMAILEGARVIVLELLQLLGLNLPPSWTESSLLP